MISTPSSNNGEFSKRTRDVGSFHSSKIDNPRFEAQPDQIPPQNLEAEEFVLGGILLDPDAIGRIADLVQADAFYISSQREIYKTALMLHSQGKPTDLTAMSAWLADTNSLEKVGGNNRLVELVERVTSTCLLYTSPSPRDKRQSRMPSSA